ncbi:hypothetical protein ACHAPO_012115 [Fusarium lateritium]
MPLGLPVVQAKAVPRGTPKFEAEREALLQAFASKVPKDYRLPLDIIQNPPSNVTEIPATCGILSSAEIDITEKHNAVSLLQVIASRKYTAEEVAKAFYKRAVIAH